MLALPHLFPAEVRKNCESARETLPRATYAVSAGLAVEGDQLLQVESTVPTCEGVAAPAFRAQARACADARCDWGDAESSPR